MSVMSTPPYTGPLQPHGDVWDPCLMECAGGEEVTTFFHDITIILTNSYYSLFIPLTLGWNDVVILWIVLGTEIVQLQLLFLIITPLIILHLQTLDNVGIVAAASVLPLEPQLEVNSVSGYRPRKGFLQGIRYD